MDINVLELISFLHTAPSQFHLFTNSVHICYGRKTFVLDLEEGILYGFNGPVNPYEEGLFYKNTNLPSSEQELAKLISSVLDYQENIL